MTTRTLPNQTEMFPIPRPADTAGWGMADRERAAFLAGYRAGRADAAAEALAEKDHEFDAYADHMEAAHERGDI